MVAKPGGHLMQVADWRNCVEQAVQIEKLPQAWPDARHALATGGWPAAVLVAVEADVHPSIRFVQRSDALSHHPGQISFPGGRIEPSDADPVCAALREAREEIGLDGRFVTVIGRLPTYNIVTGFVVEPVVAWVEPVPTPVPDGSEVVRTFSVPLDYATCDSHYRAGHFRRAGRDHFFYSIDFEGNHIWGATAGMLLELVRRIALVRGQPFRMPEVAEVES